MKRNLDEIMAKLWSIAPEGVITLKAEDVARALGVNRATWLRTRSVLVQEGFVSVESEAGRHASRLTLNRRTCDGSNATVGRSNATVPEVRTTRNSKENNDDDQGHGLSPTVASATVERDGWVAPMMALLERIAVALERQSGSSSSDFSEEEIKRAAKVKARLYVEKIKRARKQPDSLEAIQAHCERLVRATPSQVPSLLAQENVKPKAAANVPPQILALKKLQEEQNAMRALKGAV